MLDPCQAPAAVSPTFREIEEAQTGTDHEPHLWLSPIVPAADEGEMAELARRSLDTTHGPHSVREARSLDEAEQWWQVFHHEATEGLIASRRRDRATGDLVMVAADLIEAHLGPVRHAARIAFDCDTCGDAASRDLLLVSDDWATVLHLGVND